MHTNRSTFEVLNGYFIFRGICFKVPSGNIILRKSEIP